MGFWKLIMCGVGAAFVIMGVGGCGESARSKANAERNAQREAEMDGTVTPTSATPSLMPAYSGKNSVKAGEVAQVPAGISGPGVLRVSFTMKQKVSVGLVPKSEAGKYRNVSEFMSAMETTKCTNSGEGTVKLSCDLSEADKDMVILIGDRRDPAQAMKDAFDPKKQSEEGGLGGLISMDVWFGVAPKN